MTAKFKNATRSYRRVVPSRLRGSSLLRGSQHAESYSLEKKWASAWVKNAVKVKGPLKAFDSYMMHAAYVGTVHMRAELLAQSSRRAEHRGVLKMLWKDLCNESMPSEGHKNAVNEPVCRQRSVINLGRSLLHEDSCDHYHRFCVVLRPACVTSFASVKAHSCTHKC